MLRFPGPRKVLESYWSLARVVVGGVKESRGFPIPEVVFETEEGV